MPGLLRLRRGTPPGREENFVYRASFGKAPYHLPRLPLPAIASVLSFTVSATVLTALLPGAAFAQIGPGAPNVYAITNARIVPISGPIVPKGTIVLRDGLIAAVGATVTVPADAQVIDGTGLTIYPALVNGYGRVGMPDASEYPTPRGDVYPVSTVRAENNAPALLKPDSAAALALRRVGFGTSLAAPYVGILAGTSAVVSLADASDPAALVLRPSAFMHGDFDAPNAAGGGDYPESLMGEIATMRQAFYDTQTAAVVGDAFEKDPRGRMRPATPRALLALRPVVVEKRQSLAIHADSALAIRRALKLAREFGLRPVIEGGIEAYAVASDLKAAHASVLLSANLPAPPRVTPGDEDPSTLQGLRLRALAPTSAAALARAGVPFAITTAGMTTPGDFTRNVRRMVAAGLPISAAVEATTLTPAKLLGVERQVGTLETGKVADVLVTKGDLFADKTSIRYLFVDGKKQEVEPEKAMTAAGTPGMSAARAASIADSLPPGITPAQALQFLRADPASAAPYLPQGMTAEQAIKELEALVSGVTPQGETPPVVAPPPAETTPPAGLPANAPPAGVVGTGGRPGGGGRRVGGEARTPSTAPALDGEIVTAPPPVGAGLVPPLPPALPASFVLRNADAIWTSGPQGVVKNADVYVKDGKIAAVGIGLKVPAGTREVDAKGKQVTPGMIDCHSHTAVSGGVNEGSNIVTAECRIEDVIDSEDVNIYRQLAGGTTAANVLHGSANAIGGQNDVVKWRWGKTAEEMHIAGALGGVKFALGENPKQSNFRLPGRPLRYPSTRMGVERVIRETFLKARDYKAQWALYKAGSLPAPPRRDLQLDAIVEVLDGKRLVHCHSYRQDEILMLIRLAEEFGFRVATFQHVLEGYKIADEIAKHGAGASTFSDWWAFKIEAWDAIPYNGALMNERGVVVSFNSDDSELARRLNLEAAKAVHWGGVDPVEALKFVTINPAKQLHIDKMTGSLEPGKDADLVVWSGSPLSTASVCEKTIVDGMLYFDRQADIAARPALQAEKVRLSAAEKPRGIALPAPFGGDAYAAGGNASLHHESSVSSALPKGAGGRSSPLTAIVNGTVHPISGPEIANGVVLMQNGVITAVGASGSVTVPDGAVKVDAAGLHVYPGMIDANTGGLGISEIESLTATQDGRELGDFSPELRAAVAVNPDSELIRVARANGILAGVTAPTGGTFSGMGALLQLDGWTSENLAIDPTVGLYVNFPSTGGRRFREMSDQDEETSGDPGAIMSDDPAFLSGADVPATSRDKDALKYGQFPLTAQGPVAPQVAPQAAPPAPGVPPVGNRRGLRPGGFGVPGVGAAAAPDPNALLKPLNDFMAEARRYRQSRMAEGKAPAIAHHDPRLEAMIPVLNGAIPVFIRASREKDIRTAVAWAKKNGLRLVIVGGTEADKAADLLVKENVPVILGEVLALPPRFDSPYDDAYTLPARLAKAGVQFCLSTGAPSDVRRLPYQAGMASAFGLPADEALKAITLYPARILGAGGRLGSLEAGKDADIILTTGNPLEVTSVVKAAYCVGLPVDLGNKQLRLYEKYRARPKKM